MFLNELQTEEKQAFLELAALMAKIDGNLSIYEGAIIEKYKKETGLENYKIKGFAIDEILPKFKSERSKKIVITEILRLVYADGIFHDKERESIHFIKKYFGFAPDEFNSLRDWVTNMEKLSASKEE